MQDAKDYTKNMWKDSSQPVYQQNIASPYNFSVWSYTEFMEENFVFQTCWLWNIEYTRELFMEKLNQN